MSDTLDIFIDLGSFIQFTTVKHSKFSTWVVVHTLIQVYEAVDFFMCSGYRAKNIIGQTMNSSMD